MDVNGFETRSIMAGQDYKNWSNFEIVPPIVNSTTFYQRDPVNVDVSAACFFFFTYCPTCVKVFLWRFQNQVHFRRINITTVDSATQLVTFWSNVLRHWIMLSMRLCIHLGMRRFPHYCVFWNRAIILYRVVNKWAPLESFSQTMLNHRQWLLILLIQLMQIMWKQPSNWIQKQEQMKLCESYEFVVK